MRANSFDLLRLVAALLVLAGHSFAMTGNVAPGALGRGLHVLGVEIFFAISGYLIAESLKRDRHPVRFFAKRALRIFPALWLATAIFVVLGAFLTTLPLVDYSLHPGTASFLLNGILNIHFTLPGVFSHPGGGMNGSWWSLPVEAIMYVVLYLLMLFGPRAGVLLGAALYVATWLVLQQGVDFRVYGLPISMILPLASFFLCGAAMSAFPSILRPNARVAIVLAVVAVLLTSPWQEWYVAPLIAYFTVSLGLLPDLFPWHRKRIGDVSYGLYLYAPFVQQLLISAAVGITAPVLLTLFATPITFGFALLSWHLVERRALELKPRSSAPMLSPSPAPTVLHRTA